MRDVASTATLQLDPAITSAGALTPLLEREFKPKTDEARITVAEAVRVLAEKAVAHAPLVSSSAVTTIEAIISELDRQLSAQINLILHHPDFQKLEASWRGLEYLVNNSQTNDALRIRVMDVSKTELARNLRSYKGTAWDQSPLFKKVYEEEFGQFGGEPFGSLVVDYEFDHSLADVNLLAGLAKVAAAAHSPMLAAVSPSLMQMDSWREVGNPREIANIFKTPEYAAWNTFRASQDARYVGLTLPRMLARAPYGDRTLPVEEFAFEEDISGGADSFVWSSSAYAMAVNVNRAFSLYGWCSRIRGVESGGSVEGLPVFTLPTSVNGDERNCPTEIAISDRRESELASVGLMPLVYRKNSDSAAFIGARSAHEPRHYEDADAAANAALSTRLPYIFATSRFAHYLKCIARDKVGTFKTRDDMQRWLNEWVIRYVDGDPTISSEDTKAKRPLAAAEVVVTEIDGDPGNYNATFYLRPHYQLEGLTVSLRLVSKLPSARDRA